MQKTGFAPPTNHTGTRGTTFPNPPKKEKRMEPGIPASMRFFLMGTPYFPKLRYRKVTTCPRVQPAAGPKVSTSMPLVTFVAEAHLTATV